MNNIRFTALLLAALSTFPATAQTAAQKELREIYRELIEIDTTHEHGDTLLAANAMAQRLEAGGVAEVQVLSNEPKHGNLVARIRGTGKKRPILLLAHLDVVEAKREDWKFDPFVLREEDGYFWARGAIDDKAMAASFVANLIRYRREGFVPDRDIILALTADEEGGGHNGVMWLLAEHRPLVDAELAINEGGGGRLVKGKPVLVSLQASEKTFQNFHFEVQDEGGHSALPRKENAIYTLAAALGRLAEYQFPINTNEVTRAYLDRVADIDGGKLAPDMKAVAAGSLDPGVLARVTANSAYNSQLRTTCVATKVEGGHADNALPQRARATVNCRVLADESLEQVRERLVDAVADRRVSITPSGKATPGPASALRPDVMSAVEQVTREIWPGTLVVPAMSASATDSRYLRGAGIAAYGTSGVFVEFGENRAHGLDERIGVKALYDAQEYLYRLVRLLAKQ
jgi:acetylornithine deacetylase/succinyl-diaminopimelate desuccinylase-like protein